MSPPPNPSPLPPDVLPLRVESVRVMVAPGPSLSIAPPLPRAPAAVPPATLSVKSQSVMVAVEGAVGPVRKPALLSFVERLLTVVETCRRQKRNVLSWLVEAVVAR